MTLGEKIRKRRKELDMTMEDLGRAIGVQRSAINKYEKGIVDDPKLTTLCALARALDVPLLYLVEEDQSSTMEVTDTERAIITAYRRADNSTQSAVRAVLHVEEQKTPASSAG